GDGVRLSEPLRGLRISGSAGDGGGCPGDHVEQLGACGGRRRRGAVGGSAQPERAASCDVAAADVGRTANGTRRSGQGEGGALPLGALRREKCEVLRARLWVAHALQREVGSLPSGVMVARIVSR